MTAPPPAPPSARVELAGPDTWASIAYDVDGPSFEFVRPPFTFNIPLTDDELRGMAVGVFPEQVEVALASAALSPAPPLTEADWEAFRRIARAALDAPPPAVPIHPDGPGTHPRPTETAGCDPAAPPVGGPTAGDGGAADADGGTPPAERVKPPGAPAREPGEADRDFKVILEFAERRAGQRRVVISVGGTDRSESFRLCAVGDWRDAFFDAAPAAVEAFFERCRELPRYRPHRPALPGGTGTVPPSRAGTTEKAKGRGKGAPTAPPLMVFAPQPGDAATGAPRGDAAGTEDPAAPAAGGANAPAPESPARPEPVKPASWQLSLLFG